MSVLTIREARTDAAAVARRTVGATVRRNENPEIPFTPEELEVLETVAREDGWVLRVHTRVPLPRSGPRDRRSCLRMEGPRGLNHIVTGLTPLTETPLLLTSESRAPQRQSRRPCAALST